jgi:hypothetical protein
VKKTTNIKKLAILGAVLSGAFMVGNASATELASPASTSTAINGGSHFITGTAVASTSRAHPWVAQIYSPAGRCLRIEVTSSPSTVDLGMQVTAPEYNTAWRDDDSAGGFRPLVKIFSTPDTGWYTVSINQYQGSAVNADFGLRYANYPVGNPNCSSPTTPNLLAPSMKGQSSPGVSPQFEEGEPGVQ